MENKNLVFMLVSIISIILLLNVIPNVSALQEVTSGDAPFSLSSWLKHNLGIGADLFSIVGDYRSCSDTPDGRITNIGGGQNKVVHLSAYCSSGSGLIDSYVNGWNPYKEWNNDISFTCLQANAPCNLEIYCCPHPECSGNSNCVNWYGSGSSCITSHEMDPNIQLQFNTWKYCSTPEDYIDCWYKPTGYTECISRRYNGQNYCPESYQGWPLYEDENDCNDQQQCTPSCSGKVCGADNGCGSPCQTGSCTGGKVCQAGICVTQCTPNCPSASTIDCGEPIPDGCGGTCSGKGTKCNTGYTCTNNQCILNQQPSAKFQITKSFSKTSGNPGDSIPVSVTVKNIGTVQGSYYIETGIAKKGWSGYSMVSAPWWENLFSFTYFKCCQANEFYDGAVVVLSPNEQNTITLNPKVPSSSSSDGCNNQGSTWAGFTNNYWIGFSACNNCYGETGHNCSIMDWQTTFTVQKPTGYCESNSDCLSNQSCILSNHTCINNPPVNYCGDSICSGAETCSNCNDCACGSGYKCESGVCNIIQTECVTGDKQQGSCPDGYRYTSANCVDGQWKPIEFYVSPCIGHEGNNNQTCVNGNSYCKSYDKYTCVNTKWSLEEANSEYCGYSNGGNNGGTGFDISKPITLLGITLALWIWVVIGLVIVFIISRVL